MVDVHAVTPDLLLDYVAYLKLRHGGYRRKPALLSVRTLAGKVSVVRSFFAWTVASGAALRNPAQDLKLGRQVMPAQRPVLTIDEVESLLETPGPDVVGLRDRAILETLYSTGLRRGELCSLDCYDLDRSGGVVWVRKGKGGRGRVVPIGWRALEALRRYLREARPELVGSPRETALFVASTTRGRLKPKALHYIVWKLGVAAGIAKPVTPHTLRHTFATHMLQGGADIHDVQAMLGHVCIGTTQIYTRVTPADLVTVHERYHPRERLRIS